MDQFVAPAMPLIDDSEFDISHELAILYRLADQPRTGRRRARSPWPAAVAITLALGWGGAAYAARSSYTVAPGETLYQIASRHLGSGMRWVEIAELNHIKDPARIQVGQAIVLPDRRERVAVPATRRNAVRPAGAGGSPSTVRTDARTAASARRTLRSGRLARSVRLVRGTGHTHEGVPVVPAGSVVLELPARRVEVHPAARAQFARPVSAERVRPQLEAEIVSPLPAPPAKDPVSPWRALDGAAFLLGALGVTGLLSATRTRAGRRSPQAQWQAAAVAFAREMPEPTSAAEPGRTPDFWGPIQTADLGALAAPVGAR